MTAPLEIAANLVTTASILLAGRNSVHTWWTGILGCVLFAVLFYSSRLYADVVLQAFFVVTSAAGWWAWIHGDRGTPLRITRSDGRLLMIAIPAGILTALSYGTVLFHFTDAYAPYIDSLLLVFSVIAQLLLMRRKLETWLFWIAVNTVAVPLFASRELYLTASLYSVYWINAVVAWLTWRSQLGPRHPLAVEA